LYPLVASFLFIINVISIREEIISIRFMLFETSSFNKEKVIHKTKAQAEADDEEFDGDTSE